MVTGATSGIERATALGLARMGAQVVMVARDPGRGEAARAEIARESGNTTVEVLRADLSVQSDIRRLAAEVTARHHGCTCSSTTRAACTRAAQRRPMALR